MKAIGIIRSVDKLGRVVIPIEQRRRLGLETDDNIEIQVNENMIFLTKYEPKCVFCKGTDEVIEKMGKHVCQGCIKEIAG